MFKKTYLLTLLAAFTLVFTSCEKDKDDADPKPRIDVSQLEKHEWLVTKHTVKVGTQEADVIEDEYESDVYAQFDGEGEFILTAEEAENNFAGSYEVDNGQITWDYPLSIIAYMKGESESTYNIEELNASTFRISFSTKINGKTVEENMTLKAQ
ncbi:hypothetical protein [Rufibacter psychrotolerans]|uniref:hypothetical protein n=1 Tax=Rufibacter psychrotolerans TaxID=2812556 RepID=UPI0019687137|nr:hypothetical protein [Rufibacter sp. SYSU D00308]